MYDQRYHSNIFLECMVILTNSVDSPTAKIRNKDWDPGAWLRYWTCIKLTDVRQMKNPIKILHKLTGKANTASNHVQHYTWAIEWVNTSGSVLSNLFWTLTFDRSGFDRLLTRDQTRGLCFRNGSQQKALNWILLSMLMPIQRTLSNSSSHQDLIKHSWFLLVNRHQPCLLWFCARHV